MERWRWHHNAGAQAMLWPMMTRRMASARAWACAVCVDVVRGEAGQVGFDEEAENRRLNRRRLVEFGPDDGGVGDGAGSDPHLLAVEDVAAVDLAGTGAHAAGVGAEAGLGETEAAELLAGSHCRQPGLL